MKTQSSQKKFCKKFTPFIYIANEYMKDHIFELWRNKLLIGHRSYTQLKQLWNWSLKKIQAWMGFKPITSAIPVQCSMLLLYYYNSMLFIANCVMKTIYHFLNNNFSNTIESLLSRSKFSFSINSVRQGDCSIVLYRTWSPQKKYSWKNCSRKTRKNPKSAVKLLRKFMPHSRLSY